MNRENYLEATVFTEGPEGAAGEASQILVKGLLASNRAIQGDIVAIEVTLPSSPPPPSLTPPGP